MSRGSILIGGGLLALLVGTYVLVGDFARGQVAAEPKAFQWEYKVIDESQGAHGGASNIQDALNRLGRDGWEMCASASDVYAGEPDRSSPTRTRMYFVLKRPKR